MRGRELSCKVARKEIQEEDKHEGVCSLMLLVNLQGTISR